MDPVALIIILAIAGYFGFQFWLFYRTRNQRGRPLPDLSDLLEPALLQKPRLVLYFWSPACPMCSQVSRVINPLLAERDDVVSLNALEHKALASRLRVMGTPTLMEIADGRIQRVLVGARNEAVIRELVG